VDVVDRIERGQIWLADLGQPEGSEQGGIRPVLIIQNDVGNQHSPTYSVCPLTSKKINKKLPTHVLLEEKCLPEVSVALVEQTRTIDGKRFIKILGKTSADVMIKIDEAIKVQLGLQEKFSNDEVTEMIRQIINIKGIIDDYGKAPKLLSVYSYQINKLKDYCNKYKKDYRQVLIENMQLTNV
jgi:mRNA interferase MazF